MPNIITSKALARDLLTGAKLKPAHPLTVNQKVSKTITSAAGTIGGVAVSIRLYAIGVIFGLIVVKGILYFKGKSYCSYLKN